MSTAAGTHAHAAEGATFPPAGSEWRHAATSAPPASGPPGLRRVVAAVTGEFDVPCSACGCRPTTLLVEWETGAYVTGLGSPPDREVEFHATFEWRYFCPLHAAAIAT